MESNQKQLNEKFKKQAFLHLYPFDGTRLKVEVMWIENPKLKSKRSLEKIVVNQLGKYQLYFSHLVKEGK